jgi:hypothetical protein
MAFGEVGTSLSKIKANSLNLGGTFGFTGTVSGLADETPLVLLSTFTSDGSDSDATFNSSLITSTYKEYMFVFNNIHPQNNEVDLQFNGSIDNGSNYNVAKTTTAFWAEEVESGGANQIQYRTGDDLAQGTGYQTVMDALGNGSDESGSGIMRLYNPSSTTFVKHFMTQVHYYHASNYAINLFTAGYLNTTSAINNIQFKMSSGEIQGGTIDLFGVV